VVISEEKEHMMGLTIYQVDAFTDQPFAGNPAAVCLLDEPRDDAWLQLVAREMNLSETAFLTKREAGFQLRWFTPALEVDLCGHATLASAHTLWETGALAPDERAVFHTRSGELTARFDGESIELNFPATPDEPAEAPPELIRALGAAPVYVGQSKFDYLIELESEEAVKKIAPDFALLKTLPARGVIVTAPAASGDYDFVSRFFAPASGVDEDPVTGSAHCCLGPYWQKRLGKDEFMARQVSTRGGDLQVRVLGERVFLGGKAVTVMRGELTDSAVR
jgi:PhzF family phenazine biosynthesis protein